MNCSRSSLVSNCRKALRSSGEMMYVTSSVSHCLYSKPNSFSVLCIFRFVALSIFCGAGGIPGSCACCAETIGIVMAIEKIETNRVRTTLNMKTPQALGRCDSNPRPVPRQSEESPSFCDTCPPKSVRSLAFQIGCLTVFDLNEGTGEMAQKNIAIDPRILSGILPLGSTESRESTERAAGECLNLRGYRRWPARGGGNPPCAQKYLEAADRVPPRGAT